MAKHGGEYHTTFRSALYEIRQSATVGDTIVANRATGQEAYFQPGNDSSEIRYAIAALPPDKLDWYLSEYV